VCYILFDSISRNILLGGLTSYILCTEAGGMGHRDNELRKQCDNGVRGCSGCG
jgi:hypothetical protein